MEGTQNNTEIKNKKVKKAKKVKKVKPPKPIYNEFVYSPALIEAKPINTALGYAARACIVFLASFGITVFLLDAFKIHISYPLLLLAGLVITAIFAVMTLSKKYFWPGLGVTVGGLLVYMFTLGNPILSVYNSIGVLWNSMLDRLDHVGYHIAYWLYLPLASGAVFSDEAIVRHQMGGAIILLIILTAVFTLSLMKRVRVLPVLIVGAAAITIVFTYNISVTNWGFVLVLSALGGIITLKMYDSIYNRKKPVKDIQSNCFPQKGIKASANGGIAAMLAAVICFVIMLIPGFACREQRQTIDFINDRMEYARAVVSSVLLGEVADVDFGFIGNMDTLNARNTELNPRSYTGVEMLEVYSSYNMPMYLRSWIASSYSNEDNAWSTTSSSKISSYKSYFGKEFIPEELTYNFYNFLNPKFNNVPSFTSYANHIEDGFITETVDVQNINSNGNLMFTASVYNPEYGIMSFLADNRESQYKNEWNKYYEGIMTTGWFNMNKEYRFVSYVPSYRYEEFSDRLAGNLRYYEIMANAIENIKSSGISSSAAVEQTNAQLEAEGIKYSSPTALERYFALNDAGKEKFIETYIDLPGKYAEFVEQEYTDVPKSENLPGIAQEIAALWYETNQSDNIIYVDPATGEDISFEEASLTTEDAYYYTDENGVMMYLPKIVSEDTEAVRLEYSYTPMKDLYNRHSVALAVVDYLVDNYEYTLTPTQARNKHLSALDSFLHDTKEGYCVQFATAAAMLLREYGIPTRYVEGYYLNNFKYDKSPERLAKYHQTARDYNAHAWVEVYMGAAGWMTYEATVNYYADLYEPYASGSSIYNPKDELVYETQPVETEPIEEEEEEEEVIEEEKEPVISKQTIILIVATVLGLLAVGIPALIIYKHHEKVVRSYEKRYEAIARAMRSTLEGDELREIGRTLNDYIWQLHEVAGSMPNEGELPDEYAVRIDDTINASLFRFRDILTYMSCEEFGYGMERWQLREEAEYAQILWDKLWDGMSKKERFYWRNLKKMI